MSEGPFRASSFRSIIATNAFRLSGILLCCISANAITAQVVDTIAPRLPEREQRKLLVRHPEALRLRIVPTTFTPAHILKLEAIGLYDANTLYNDLLVPLWLNKWLDRGVRERTADALNGNNRAGYEVGLAISYAWGDSLFGSARIRPRISVAYRDVMGLRFADDLYKLTFFGNAAYENRTASLGPSEFEQVRYQTIGFGIEDKKSNSFLELELVNGQSLNAARIDRADLFTGTDGRYLDLDIDGTYSRSDTTGDHFGKSRGIGAAIGAEANIHLRLLHHDGVFTFGFHDLGIIAWNSNSLRLPKNGSIHYDGVRVADILDLQGALSGTAALQDTLGLGYQRGGFVRPLPAEVFGRLRVNSFDTRWMFQVQVRQRALPGYIPLASLIARAAIGPGWARVQGELSYGGFGALRLGIGGECDFTRAVTVKLGSPNIIGLMSNDARGKALMLGVDVAW